MGKAWSANRRELKEGGGNANLVASHGGRADEYGWNGDVGERPEVAL